MKIGKTIFILCTFVVVLAISSITDAAEKCEEADGFLILKNQKYALCALTSCLTFN